MAVVLTIRGVGIITSIHNVDPLHILMAYMGITGCSMSSTGNVCGHTPAGQWCVLYSHSVLCPGPTERSV